MSYPTASNSGEPNLLPDERMSEQPVQQTEEKTITQRLRDLSDAPFACYAILKHFLEGGNDVQVQALIAAFEPGTMQNFSDDCFEVACGIILKSKQSLSATIFCCLYEGMDSGSIRRVAAARNTMDALIPDWEIRFGANEESN